MHVAGDQASMPLVIIIIMSIITGEFHMRAHGRYEGMFSLPAPMGALGQHYGCHVNLFSKVFSKSLLIGILLPVESFPTFVSESLLFLSFLTATFVPMGIWKLRKF